MNTLCASTVCFITLQLSHTHLSTNKAITIIDTTEKTAFIYVSSATIKERKCDLLQSKAASDIALIAGSFGVSPVTEWAEILERFLLLYDDKKVAHEATIISVTS